MRGEKIVTDRVWGFPVFAIRRYLNSVVYNDFFGLHSALQSWPESHFSLILEYY